MISPKKLITMAKKRHKAASKGRKRISLPKTCSTSYVADKDHFVNYSTDQRRFILPLACLQNNIFLELLKMSKEEFGLSSSGPIRLPCDSIILNYIVSLIQWGVTAYLEKALSNSIAICCCSSSTSLQYVLANNNHSYMVTE